MRILFKFSIIAFVMLWCGLAVAQQSSLIKVPGEKIDTRFLNPDAECTGTGEIIYDDGTFENGYGWNPIVTDGRFVQLITPSSYPWQFNTFCLALTRVAASPANFTFDIVMYDNTGTGGAPGNEIGIVTGVTATNIPIWSTLAFYDFDVSSLPAVASGSVYLGIKYNPSLHSGPIYSGADESTGTPLQTGYGYSTSGWGTIQSLFPNYRALGYRTLGSSGGPTVISIAEAIEDLNMDYVPDRLGQTVTVEGVVFSPNYQTTNNSFYIHDGTAGTDIFMYSPPVFTWAYGDMLQITGEVSQYNGMTEIIPADSTGWVFQSSGNPTPDPILLTLAQYKADPEMYEGSLVGFVSLSLASGTWPAMGSSANLSLTDGMDTVVFRIDSDTDIDGQPEPTWPVDVIGIGSQFDSSTPPDGGYQIFPRYYATDFLPAGSIPVELSSFTASANQGNVTLNWSTATETNNNGFEIQRSTDGEFFTIGFVSGNGTSTEMHEYSYVDRDLSAGSYSYRLKQMDYSGSFSYSSVFNIDVSPTHFELAQNYPNPFNPSTTINFTIPQSSVVTLKIYNTLGQEVKTLINGNMESGVHSISFDASDLNSGIYFYKVEAGQFSDVRKMTLIK